MHWLMSDLTSLVSQQFSHWLHVRKVGTPVVVIIIIIIIIIIISIMVLGEPTISIL